MTSPTQLIASDDTLQSITIFKSDRAEVTRTFTTTLQTEQNNVEIVGLSSYIDIDSVRVTGLGDARLFEASCKIQRRDTWQKAESSDAERIRVLKDKKGVLTQEKNVCDAASLLLRDYGKTLSGEHIAPADAYAFLEKYLEQGSALARTAAKLDEEMIQVQREIETITNKCSSKKGETDGRVHVTIMAKTQTEVVLKLIYVVREACWKPSYELHARADESGLPASSVSLHYRATITQTTGEDWHGVALALSTASPSLADESIPELKHTRISLAFAPSGFKPFKTPEIQPQSMRSASVMVVGSNSAVGEGEGELMNSPSAFEPVTSIAKESPLSVLYKIDGKSSIASDGEAHKVSIAELPFEASVSHVVVPKVKAVVYLEAKVKNASDYRLITGPVDVFFDDSLVSKTSIKDIGPGGEFTCTLGPDTGTRVTYKRISKLEKETTSRFSEKTVTTAYTALTTISNTHPFALAQLVVRDGLPISDDGNRVRVILREPSVLAEMEQGEQKEAGEHKITWCSPSGQKDGIYEYLCSLESGKEIKLSTTWSVKAPADVKWVERS